MATVSLAAWSGLPGDGFDDRMNTVVLLLKHSWVPPYTGSTNSLAGIGHMARLGQLWSKSGHGGRILARVLGETPVDRDR